MNKKYNIEEVKGLMNWIQTNKGITDEMDRTRILADVVYRMLYKVSLERYLSMFTICHSLLALSCLNSSSVNCLVSFFAFSSSNSFFFLSSGLVVFFLFLL